MSSFPSPRQSRFSETAFPLLARAGVDKLRKKGAVDIDVVNVNVVVVVDTCENIIRLS